MLRLLAAMLTALAVLALAVPAAADNDAMDFGPFCVSAAAPGTLEQRDAVRAAYVAADYPWEALSHAVQRQHKRGCILIEFIDGDGSARYYSVSVRVQLDTDLTPYSTSMNFLYEVAHAVDYLTMTDEQRQYLYDYAHTTKGLDPNDGHCWLLSCDYRYQVGEAFMWSFTKAFAPTHAPSSHSFSHGISPTEVRSVVLLASEDEYPPPEPSFSDTAGTTHEAAIERLAELGIIGGYSDGTYRPNATLTRGQAASILSRLLDHLEAQP